MVDLAELVEAAAPMAARAVVVVSMAAGRVRQVTMAEVVVATVAAAAGMVMVAVAVAVPVGK